MQFAFRILDIAQEPELKEPEKLTESRCIPATAAMTKKRMILGMDIGGTDIKLAAALTVGWLSARIRLVPCLVYAG